MARKEVLMWALGEILGYSMTAIAIISNIGSIRSWVMFWLVVFYWVIRGVDEGYKFYTSHKNEKKNS